MQLCSFSKAEYKAYIFLEPAYILFNFAQGIAEFADVNLYLQKTCRHDRHAEPDLTTPCDDERAGIEFVAMINSRYTCPSSIFTVAFTILLSAWSDKTGGKRKFCILIPMALKTGQLVCMCLHAYFWNWPVHAAVYTDIILQSASCVRVGSIIYICSITTPANRAYRLTFLHVLMTITNIVSSGSSGYLLRHLGFFYTYVICSLLSMAATIHIGLLVKNTAAKRTNGWIMCICDFIDTRYVVEAFKIVFKKREGNARMIISLLSAVNVLAWTAYIGERSVLYLYLRYKFGWNEVDYGPYIFYKLFGISAGTMLCIAVKKLFNISDGTIGTFAAFWDTLAASAYYLATEEWQLYLIPLLDIFHGFALTVCESMRSTFFETHEFGRLLSVHMTLNMGLSFTYPAYNLLFRKTMDTQPASIFLLSCAVNSVTYILYGICSILIKKLPAPQPNHQINRPTQGT